VLAVGVVALAGFVRVQKRSDHPLVPPRLFQSRVFTAGNILTFFLYMAVSTVFFFLPLNLIQAQGYPESLAGLASLPFIIMVTVMSTWAGGMYDRIGSRLMLTIGPLIAGLGMAALGLPGLTGGPADYWLTYFPGIALLGIGMGIIVAPLTAAVMKSAPDSLAGAASGTNNAIASTAGVLAIAILGALALTVFGRILVAESAALPIAQTARLALMAEASELGGATVPPGITGDAAADASLMIRQGFATTFRLIMFICAVLAWASALVWYSLCRGQFVPPRWVME
jgi:MFS family permease